MTQKQALGRGLAALIPQKAAVDLTEQIEKTNEIAVSSIRPNKFQPRVKINEVELEELAQSIKEQGFLQPVVVRPDNGGYELIIGERRLKAAQRLGLDRIPAVIKEADDTKMLEWAVIENIQREDLNPMEESKAYQRLIDEFKFSQEDVSKKVGKSRTTITNSLRLLTLSQKVQDLIQSGQISAGHAKAILGLENLRKQEEIAVRVLKNGWSVRETEQKVQEINIGKKFSRRTIKKEPQILALEEALKNKLGTPVFIRSRKNSGRIEIYFYTLDDFDRLMDFFGIEKF